MSFPHNWVPPTIGEKYKRTVPSSCKLYRTHKYFAISIIAEKSIIAAGFSVLLDFLCIIVYNRQINIFQTAVVLSRTQHLRDIFRFTYA